MSLFNEATFLMIPNTYKEGKVFSQVPKYTSNGDLTFTRSSVGTRVNKNGVIENSPYNLLQRSEEFDNAYWTKLGTGTGVTPSVTPNVGLAPNGTMTADRVIFNKGGGNTTSDLSELYHDSIFLPSGVITKSIYVKSFDGATYSMSIAAGLTITVTDQWQRFTSSNGGERYRLFIRGANPSGLSQTADVLVWGAQFEYGSTASTYFPTTDRLNLPRIDYSSGIGSLLLEPQRTNTLLQSVDFTSGSWAKVATTVSLHPTIKAPDGSLAYHFVKQDNTSHTYQGPTTANTYRKSIYARTVSGTGSIHITGRFSTSRYLVNLTTEWKRFDFQVDITEDSGNGALFYPVDFRGNTGLNEVLLWGPQNELGLFPTSYIPTTGGTSTRTVDSYTRSNIFTNGLISSQGGTWFVELVNSVQLTRDSAAAGLYIDTSINGSTTGLSIRHSGAVNTRAQIGHFVSGVGFTGLYSSTSDNPKIVMKWNGTSLDIFHNGVKEVIGASFSFTTMEFLGGTGADFTKSIKQMALWNKPLTDKQCFELTGNTLSERLLLQGGVTEAQDTVANIRASLRNNNLLDSTTFLLTPSSYVEGVVYGNIPSYSASDLTFTRASTATSTNSSGLVENSPRNLLQRSEEFDNAVWSKGDVFITPNVILSPNGTLTADRAVNGIDNNRKDISDFGLDSLNGYTVSMSIYIKFFGNRYFTLGTVSNRIVFDFQTNSITIANGVVNPFSIDVGNGWYRIGCTIQSLDNGRFVSVTHNVPISQTNTFFVGDNLNGVYLWGAQLEIGSNVTQYLRTTNRLNTPRIDYSTGNPTLLLEPQRTNLLLRSEELNLGWTNISTVVVTANQVLSPNGTITADLVNISAFTGSTSGGTRLIQDNGAGLSLTTGQTYTFSFYARSVSGRGSFPYGWFTGSTYIKSYADLTTEWKRFSVTFNAVTGNNAVGFTRRGDTHLETLTQAYIWGAQVELGGYTTSYIPTTTTTVTRIADSFTRNNLFTNNLISSQGGTWLLELDNNVPLTRDAISNGIFLDVDTSLNNSLRIRNNGTDRLSLTKTIGGTATTIYTTTTNNCKLIIKWNGSTADVFENGIKVVTSTSFTPTAMQNLNATNADVPKYIRQMGLWNTPLTDAQCISLSNNNYDVDTLAFIYATGITNINQINIVDSLVRGLKDADIWNKMKAIYPFIGGTVDTHKFNLKDPRDLDSAFRLVFTGGTHLSTGYRIGTTAIDTKLIPSGNYSDNTNAHMSIYTPSVPTGIIMRSVQTEQQALRLENTSIYHWDSLGGTGHGRIQVSTRTNVGGFLMGSRTSNSYTSLFRNGVKLTSSSVTNSNINGLVPTSSIVIGGNSLDISFATIGNGLTDRESIVLYRIVQQYQTSLARQVTENVLGEARDFIVAADIQDTTQINAINNLVAGLKAIGVWTKLKAVYPFVGGTANSHKFNLKDPRDLDAAYRLQFFGGITHDANGVLPNGTSGYANSFINPSNIWTTTFNSHMSFYTRSSGITSGSQTEIGVQIGSSRSLLIIGRASDDLAIYTTYHTSYTETTYLPTSASGYVVGTQLTSLSNKLFKNNELMQVKNTSTTLGSSLPNGNLFLFGRNLDNVSSNFSPKQCAFASIGDGLTDTEAAGLYNIVQQYQTALGRQV